MNGSLFSITRYMYMNGVCFKVSGGTFVPKLPPSYPPHPEDLQNKNLMALFRELFNALRNGGKFCHQSSSHSFDRIVFILAGITISRMSWNFGLIPL